VPTTVDRSGDDLALPVAAVARRLGVAPTTLRTWDRRYGLGPSVRESGTHRRYTATDVARLDAMRRLVLAGVTPSEAAHRALTSDHPELLGSAPAQEPLRRAGTGGRVLPLTKAAPWTRGVARAAMALDGPAVTEALVESIGEDGVGPTWEDLLRPLLVAIGERWSHTGEGVEVEHLLSECAITALHRAVPLRPLDGRTRPVLLASAPDELHSLPLVVLGAALAEHAVPARVLGAATPADALTAAVRRIGPAALLLWSQTREYGRIEVFDGVPRLRPATTLLAGGPGWPAVLPPGVIYVTSLRHAVDVILAAARGTALDA
jgi:MerR family transcriptional regulator, light-induced transcriptional regulator